MAFFVHCQWVVLAQCHLLLSPFAPRMCVKLERFKVSLEIHVSFAERTTTMVSKVDGIERWPTGNAGPRLAPEVHSNSETRRLTICFAENRSA